MNDVVVFVIACVVCGLVVAFDGWRLTRKGKK